MRPRRLEELSAEQRREIAAWIDANRSAMPESVRSFLALHEGYLNAEGNLRKALDAALRDLRRALHITPSSEKRRPSGSPLAALPRAEQLGARSPREELEEQIARRRKLSKWHRELNKRHGKRIVQLQEKLSKMSAEKTDKSEKKKIHEPERLEDIPLTEEELAESEQAADRFNEHVLRGNGADPAMTPMNETLMPGGAVLEHEEQVSLPVTVPEDLVDGRVVRTLHEPRVRYDFSVAVTRIELDVEKKVIVNSDGDRHVIAASTSDYGPPRYAVTWNALATLAILVGQFAMPFNRLATMFSTDTKRFTAGAFSRMLRYIAQRFVPIYLELAAQLVDAEILAGDDTSCRVLEVSTHFAKVKASEQSALPWADYQTPNIAEASFNRCREERKARLQRRESGDRSATPTPDENPSLGILIGRVLPFESQLRSGDGPKEALHITVISGRSHAADPRSSIIFYRSHLGSCGNLFEWMLERRKPTSRTVILQTDLSTSNSVSSPALRARFDIRQIGCGAHARRPFANFVEEDLEHCEYMLHLFLGLAIHEEELNVHGRNRDNVLAVRGNESRELWNEILDLAKTIANKWSKATQLGTAARYIINHFDALTAYLDDPRLEHTNNLRERMLRTEKLIEASSMFRRSLDGRFALDIVRTILQTAVAADVPVHEYLVSVLRVSDDEIQMQPGRYTPRAWATRNGADSKTADASS